MLLDAQAEAIMVQLTIGRVVIEAGDQRRLVVAGFGALALESRLERRKLARIGREFESGFGHDISASFET